MLIGNNYIFNFIFLLNIITPFLIVIFFKKPWEKIPIFYGALILYIIISAWILHFFRLLNPYLWGLVTVSSFFFFLLFSVKKGDWLKFNLKEKNTYNISNKFVYLLIIGWTFISYFRIASLPVLLSDSKTMHLFQQAYYFQENCFSFHNSNNWEAAFRPLNALLWNMFFSIFLEDNSLIESPQIISWVGLIFISGSIFSLLKVNNKLAGLIMLTIGFSPRILSLSTNNLIDLTSLLYFSGAIYYLLKLNTKNKIKIIDLIMFGTYCGAYLGARMQGFIIIPLLIFYSLYIFLKKRSHPFKTLLIPIFITVALGTGKYFMNYLSYNSPIPLNINSSNSLSLITFLENLKILTNNILDRSWNLYGILSFQANSAIIGFPINFFIVPYAFYGFLNTKHRNNHKSSAIFAIGLVFLFFAMITLKSPSPNYNSRLWLPFIFTAVIFGAETINTLLKEKKLVSVLTIFSLTIFGSIIIYGGIYRKAFVLVLFISIIYVLKTKNIDSRFILKTLSILVMVISLLYSAMNILYDRSSQILKYKEINQQYDQSVLVKLSKYLKQGSRVGILNLKDQCCAPFPIYDLFGPQHSIKARLVFDWIEDNKLKYLSEKELDVNYDILILNTLSNNEILDIKNFLLIEKFHNYYIYQNKKLTL
tara:strand:- start:5312 stop:7255 length:1944 start_codon:yes stop_codon:yes gene_type:complete